MILLVNKHVVGSYCFPGTRLDAVNTEIKEDINSPLIRSIKGGSANNQNPVWISKGSE